MPHTIRDKAKLLARVRRIQGQAAALEKQLNEEGDCTEVLQQIAAIRGAVNGLMSQVLEAHIREDFGHAAASDALLNEKIIYLPPDEVFDLHRKRL